MASAGSLRERVTIQSATEAADGYGGNTVTWATLATVWAQVTPVKGREAEDVGRLAGLQTYLVTIRHRTDVGLDDRVVWGSKTLNIRSLTNRDEHKHWLVMECEEGVQNG